MIRSIIDNDLYKFSMANAVLQLFPNLRVSYRFTDRKGKGRWTAPALKELNKRIKAMSKLSLTREERVFCETQMPWINRTFWDFLANYRYDPKEVRVWLDDKQNLQMEIKGLWCRTIFWEVPLLALVCEVYYEMIDTNWSEDGQVEKMEDKARRLFEAGVAWGDVGTRRRRHFAAQERVVEIGKKYANFTGTSNVYLAMKHGVKPLGTMAHEWVMRTRPSSRSSMPTATPCSPGTRSTRATWVRLCPTPTAPTPSWATSRASWRVSSTRFAMTRATPTSGPRR